MDRPRQGQKPRAPYQGAMRETALNRAGPSRLPAEDRASSNLQVPRTPARSRSRDSMASAATSDSFLSTPASFSRTRPAESDLYSEYEEGEEAEELTAAFEGLDLQSQASFSPSPRAPRLVRPNRPSTLQRDAFDSQSEDELSWGEHSSSSSSPGETEKSTYVLRTPRPPTSSHFIPAADHDSPQKAHADMSNRLSSWASPSANQAGPSRQPASSPSSSRLATPGPVSSQSSTEQDRKAAQNYEAFSTEHANVSESWDEDFLFGDEAAARSQAAREGRKKKSARASKTRGRDSHSYLASNDAKLESRDGFGDLRERDAQTYADKFDDDDAEPTWDSDYLARCRPGLSVSASNATIQPRHTSASSPSESHAPECTQRTPSRASGRSTETDFSARLAHQSEVSSWRSRLSTGSSIASQNRLNRDRTPSLSGSQVDVSRDTRREMRLGDEISDEEGAEVYTSDAATEQGSTCGDVPSGEETETEVAMTSHPSADFRRRNPGRFISASSAAAAGPIPIYTSTRQRVKRPTSANDAAAKELRSRRFDPKRNSLSTFGSAEHYASSASTQQSAHFAEQHAVSSPSELQTGIFTDRLAEANRSTSSFSRMPGRDALRLTFRDFFERSSSPRHSKQGKADPAVAYSSSPSRTGRWLEKLHFARMHGGSDSPRRAERESPSGESPESAYLDHASHSPHAKTNGAASMQRSGPSAVARIQVRAGSPITPARKDSLHADGAHRYAAPIDRLGDTAPSPVRTLSASYHVDSPTQFDAVQPRSATSSAHKQAVRRATHYADAAARLEGTRKVPSHREAQTHAGRSLSASTSETQTSDSTRSISDRWTGTSGAGTETSATSDFGSSYDDKSPSSITWSTRHRRLSSDGASTEGSAASRSSSALLRARKDPRTSLQQLPEGRTADVMPTLEDTRAMDRAQGLSKASMSSSTSSSDPDGPPSRAGAYSVDRQRVYLSRPSATEHASNESDDRTLTQQDYHLEEARPSMTRNATVGALGQGSIAELSKREGTDSKVMPKAGSRRKKAKQISRRNSLGDLRIPARISQAQKGIKANMTHVREFAKGIEDIKELRAKYLAILGALQDSPDLEKYPNASPTEAKEMMMTDPEVSVQVHSIDESMRHWWEMAEVLVGLADGTSEADENADLATLDLSPRGSMHRSRTTTLESPACLHRKAVTRNDQLSLPLVLASDQASTIRPRSDAHGSSGARTSSGSRFVDPQRELDIIAAMLAGTAPEHASAAAAVRASLMVDRQQDTAYALGSSGSDQTQGLPAPPSARLSFAETSAAERPEEYSRRAQGRSEAYSTAPAGISPFAAMSTDTLDDNPMSERSRHKSANKAARGLQSLLELVRSLKTAPDMQGRNFGSVAGGSEEASASQLSLNRRAGRGLSLFLSSTDSPRARPSTDHTSPSHRLTEQGLERDASLPSLPPTPVTAKRRSLISRVRPDPARPEQEDSPRRKRSASRLFSRGGDSTPSLPSTLLAFGAQARPRVVSAASAQSAGSSSGNGSFDSSWMHVMPSTKPSHQRRSSVKANSSAGASFQLQQPPQRRHRVLSLFGNRSRGASISAEPKTDGARHFGVSKGSAEAESLGSDSIPLPTSAIYAQNTAIGSRADGPSPPSSGSHNVSQLATTTRSAPASSRLSMARSQGLEGSVGPQEAANRPSAATEATQATESSSGHSWSQSPESAASSYLPSSTIALAPTDSTRSTSISAGDSTVFRKMALSPEAIPSLLVYVHATRQHCASALSALSALQSGANVSDFSHMAPRSPPSTINAFCGSTPKDKGRRGSVAA
ncbi:hypothetical protein IE81DRAFT_320367 [Ceraceosorus guamensis]|uniref:Uncharacterized protein n=1 Tax=Ceraceosorus guamensis TaxID=1522189 RepID=A0A316WCC8_9BASI|nr:hypothetical protein IE81DRAFT_320367 [Ceraceosorus guamensis]PWN45195.1 hypothetical protein IE81DRAFT_320367 [Ceraceosorus guamensis]